MPNRGVAPRPQGQLAAGITWLGGVRQRLRRTRAEFETARQRLLHLASRSFFAHEANEESRHGPWSREWFTLAFRGGSSPETRVRIRTRVSSPSRCLARSGAKCRRSAWAHEHEQGDHREQRKPMPPNSRTTWAARSRFDFPFLPRARYFSIKSARVCLTSFLSATMRTVIPPVITLAPRGPWTAPSGL